MGVCMCVGSSVVCKEVEGSRVLGMRLTMAVDSVAEATAAGSAAAGSA